MNNATQGNSTQQSSCDGAYERPWTSFNIQYSLFCYFDTFPWEIFSKLWGAKSYPSEKLSPKPHFLLRHFLTFSIIARIIYALMCQTCYIRYHKIYSAKFKIGNSSSSCCHTVWKQDYLQLFDIFPQTYWFTKG